jgi:hypothetical protein
MAGALDDDIATHAARHHGLISKAELKRLGATPDAIRHRVTKHRLLAVLPDVYLLAGAPWTWRCKVLAATLAAGPDANASHRTAAALFLLPGFDTRALEIVVPRRLRRRLPGVTVHHVGVLPHHHSRVVDAIPVTSIARTLFDLSGCVRPELAERALDHCLARRLVTVPACWRAMDDLAARGRPGTAIMRALLSARGAGYVAPASELERRMLRLLTDAGLPPPAREIDVGDADRWVGRVELVYRAARVLIEVDSRLHHTMLDDYERDRVRDNSLVADGWRVLRFTYEQITRHPDIVIRTVRQALGSAAGANL